MIIRYNWFVEGSAQLAGGGFTTGWNNNLLTIADSDTDISNYLKQKTPNDDEYGRGYFAAAYLGHLASGQSTISQQSVLAGMNNLFGDIRTSNMSLDQAIANRTNYSSANEINNSFVNASQTLLDLVSFITNEVASIPDIGAGSFIADSLSKGGTDIVSNSPVTDSLFTISNDSIVVPPQTGGVVVAQSNKVTLQLGANVNQTIHVNLYNISFDKLSLDTVSVSDHSSASDSIKSYEEASNKISSIRGQYGAIQNRLEHSISSLENSSENLQAAESRIRDVDITNAMVEFSKLQILQQANQSILSQANQSSQGVLFLLQ